MPGGKHVWVFPFSGGLVHELTLRSGSLTLNLAGFAALQGAFTVTKIATQLDVIATAVTARFPAHRNTSATHRRPTRLSRSHTTVIVYTVSTTSITRLNAAPCFR